MNKSKMFIFGLVATLLSSLMFLTSCVPESGESEYNIWYMIAFLVLIFALMYFVLIRPQRKRQKEHQQLMEELRKGERVITIGGIYGEIESVSEDSIVLKMESGGNIRVARSSVAGRRNK